MGLILGSGTTKPQYPYDMWYGVQGDFTSSDYKLTRIGNLDLHRTLPIQNRLRRFVENADGSVKYYLHQNDSCLTDGGANAVLDTTDGNVMLEKPDYYMRYEIDGTKWAYAISEYPLPGFMEMTRKTLAPWYSTIDAATGTAVSGCWLQWGSNGFLLRDGNGFPLFRPNVANFRGGFGAQHSDRDNTDFSMLGMPRTGLGKVSVRSMCKNGTHIGVGRVYMEIAWLQRIEYASLYSGDDYNAALTDDGFRQGGLGRIEGFTWDNWAENGHLPMIPCGITAKLGNNTGRIQYTSRGWSGGDKTFWVASYRGLEAPFQYLFMLADDILVYHSPATSSDKSTAYVCDDYEKFVSPAKDEIVAGYIPVADMPRSMGNILTMNVSQRGYTFPATLGSGLQGFCDYYEFPGVGDDVSGWYGAIISGPIHLGNIRGWGYMNVCYRSNYSFSGCGFRLCRF